MERRKTGINFTSFCSSSQQGGAQKLQAAEAAPGLFGDRDWLVGLQPLGQIKATLTS
jgi:hypothetical protein